MCWSRIFHDVTRPPNMRAVVHLRVPDRLRVLLRVEQLVLGEQSVASRVIQRITLDLDQLIDGLPLTRQARAERGGVAVCLAVVR